MAEHTCHNCIYSWCDAGLWLRRVRRGEPILPSCANHPQWPGQMHDVPGVPCRNFRPKPALPKGDVRLIPLGDGFYAYVDAADYEWLSQWQWHLHSGYAARHEKRKWIFMHRQIVKPPKGKIVDHMDGNKTNNCRCNIRPCSHRENQRNRCKERGSASRFKGVFYDRRRNKWYAKCRYEGEYYGLGYFDLETDAARAYDRAAVQWYGEFARLNFPEEWPPERRARVCAERDAAKPEGKKAGKKEGKKRTAVRTRRGESSFAHASTDRQKAKVKKDIPSRKRKAQAAGPKSRRKPNKSPQRPQRTQRHKRR
jgi:hypothetical protein